MRKHWFIHIMLAVESDNSEITQVQAFPAFTNVKSLETPKAVYGVGKTIKFWDMGESKMSTDLLTYYGQTPRIDELAEKYGAYLETLNRENKLSLRVVLSSYVLMQQRRSEEYSLLVVLEDALCEYPGRIPQELYDACKLLEGLTIDEAESVLDALQHQLHWGNAQIR